MGEEGIELIEQLHGIVRGALIALAVEGDQQRVATLQRNERILRELQLEDAHCRDGIVPLRARLARADAGDGASIMLDLALAKGEDVATIQVVLGQGKVAIVKGEARFELG